MSTDLLQMILDLHNGRLKGEFVTETVQRLWFEESDYSEGSLAFHLALARFPHPKPVDYYVAAIALINHREAEKVPNLLKLCWEDLGLWKAALEVEAGFRSGSPNTEALASLAESREPFFQAVGLLHEARYLRLTNASDRNGIRKRLVQALEAFTNVSAFETGRALLYLSQVEASYDLALATAERALEQFKICKNRHYQSDAHQAIESIREKHRERRESSRSRSLDLGSLVRPLLNAPDIESFFKGFVQILTSRMFLALEHVTILHKGIGGEHIVASHHGATPTRELPSTSLDLGSGYRLVVSQTADPMALELILPLVKRELVRLSRTVPTPHVQFRRAFGKFTYYDSRMDEVLNLLEMAAQDQPEGAIMLRGEPGVGKTDLAFALHQMGCTKAGKFVVYDATTAVDKSFMVAELFGTVKGAFTDAQPRTGKIEEAGQGTLFIDEIGELTPQCQALLLRVLQNRQFSRLGTNDMKPVQCRIILATNQPIEEWCQKPSTSESQPLFRPDLPSRFRHWIHIRSLHEIPDQIVPTALAFIREQGDFTLSPEAEIFLRSMRWIGNYRSLLNTCGLAVNFARSYGVSAITPEIIHRAIGHHPLLFTPVNEYGEGTPRVAFGMPGPALPPPMPYAPQGFMPSVPPAYAPAPPFHANPLPPSFPTAYQPPMAPVAPPLAGAQLPEAPTFAAAPVTAPLAPPPKLPTVNPQATALSLEEEEKLKETFLEMFRQVFDEFEFNRRKYFPFSILSNISQIYHQQRMPRAKTFQAIYEGLMKSPYVKLTVGAEKVQQLADLFQALEPRWAKEE
ncbi:MAG: sigma 54-interacting transcriptional regulator [Blastocatellia bacterium]|nr:sigma 54-interacting transcriptional regulator [Blastocatellia bacterium]